MTREPTRILIVDDEQHQRLILSRFLTGSEFAVEEAAGAAQALHAIESGRAFDVALTDLSMPGMDGIELIERARTVAPDLDFIVLTAHASVDSAIRAMKAGAFDYLTKPADPEEVLHRLGKLLEHRRLERRARSLETENRVLRSTRGEAGVVALSAVMRKLVSDLERVSATDTTILLQGETGAGKEVLARLVHQSSPRAQGPFVAVNCGSIPENLVESELFGHEKGAFTGADRRHIGLFESASGGTLFLDEIGEMDIKIQTKVLRAIEDRKVRRVSGTSDVPVDIRLVAATHRDLKKRVGEGTFREDLFYRLNVVQLHVPPLRERKEDLPELVARLAERFSKRSGIRVKSIEPSLIEALARHPFPGNVRELANLIERALIYSRDGRLGVEGLPSEVARGGAGHAMERAGDGASLGALWQRGRSLAELTSEHERRVLEEALAATGGDVEAVSTELRVPKSTLYTKLSKHGLK